MGRQHQPAPLRSPQGGPCSLSPRARWASHRHGPAPAPALRPEAHASTAPVGPQHPRAPDWAQSPLAPGGRPGRGPALSPHSPSGPRPRLPTRRYHPPPRPYLAADGRGGGGGAGGERDGTVRGLPRAAAAETARSAARPCSPGSAYVVRLT